MDSLQSSKDLLGVWIEKIDIGLLEKAKPERESICFEGISLLEKLFENFEPELSTRKDYIQRIDKLDDTIREILELFEETERREMLYQKGLKGKLNEFNRVIRENKQELEKRIQESQVLLADWEGKRLELEDLNAKNKVFLERINEEKTTLEEESKFYQEKIQHIEELVDTLKEEIDRFKRSRKFNLNHLKDSAKKITKYLHLENEAAAQEYDQTERAARKHLEESNKAVRKYISLRDSIEINLNEIKNSDVKLKHENTRLQNTIAANNEINKAIDYFSEEKDLLSELKELTQAVANISHRIRAYEDGLKHVITTYEESLPKLNS